MAIMKTQRMVNEMSSFRISLKPRRYEIGEHPLTHSIIKLEIPTIYILGLVALLLATTIWFMSALYSARIAAARAEAEALSDKDVYEVLKGLLAERAAAEARAEDVEIQYTALRQQYDKLTEDLNKLAPHLPVQMEGPIFTVASGVPDGARTMTEAEVINVLDLQYGETLNKIQYWLARPHSMPVREGKISSPFGPRSDPLKPWVQDMHTGVDIASPFGSGVYPTAEGRVILAGASGAYGNAVIVRHDYGYLTVYGHLNEIRVKVGQDVTRDEVIGTVGSSGRSTGPHVHYEVHLFGYPQDPVNYMDDGSGNETEASSVDPVDLEN